MDTHIRSITKATSYRVIGTATTFVVALIITGQPGMSLGIGILDSMLKIAQYYIHERIWAKSDFGRKKPPEYNI